MRWLKRFGELGWRVRPQDGNSTRARWPRQCCGCPVGSLRRVARAAAAQSVRQVVDVDVAPAHDLAGPDVAHQSDMMGQANRQHALRAGALGGDELGPKTV